MRSTIIFLFCYMFFSCTTLLGQGSDVLIFLVRHADRLGNNDALSDDGVNRSLALTHVLENVELDAIFSTDYTRTIETVKPLAQEKQLEIEIYNPGDLNALVEIIQDKYAGGKVLVVGHSNTIPQTINLMGIQPTLSNLDHGAYDDLFMVILRQDSDPTLVPLQYGVRDDH